MSKLDALDSPVTAMISSRISARSRMVAAWRVRRPARRVPHGSLVAGWCGREGRAEPQHAEPVWARRRVSAREGWSRRIGSVLGRDADRCSSGLEAARQLLCGVAERAIRDAGARAGLRL